MYRVIIVEDEVIVRKGLLLTTPWDNYNCKVIGEAKNGQEGVRLAIKHRPDIIITDIRMPILDGIKMLEKIKEIYEPIVIMITAFDEFEYAKKGIDLEVSDYLLKPFDDEQLDKALKKAITKVNYKLLLNNFNDNDDNIIKNIEHKLKITVNSKHSNLIKAINYINDNYMNDINITVTSEFLGVSESYLSHLFKSETNYTFLEFLTSVRLSKACLLLKNANIRVHEVANAVGYRDQRYFSYIFKKHLGITPNHYKENL
ncbi:MAG: response regulator [Erysipelotrichaceae bacterium]|nr:response regulator [Erysipelotrichaceae bacterium]